MHSIPLSYRGAKPGQGSGRYRRRMMIRKTWPLVLPTIAGVSLAAILGASGTAHADLQQDCNAGADLPYVDFNGQVVGDGYLACSSDFDFPTVWVELYHNGFYVTETTRRCEQWDPDWNPRICQGYTVTAPYETGEWCTVVEVRDWPTAYW